MRPRPTHTPTSRASRALLVLVAATFGCPAPEETPAPATTTAARTAATTDAPAPSTTSTSTADEWQSPTLKLRSRYRFFPSLGAATGTLPEGTIDAIVLEDPIGGAVLLVEVEVTPPSAVPPNLVTRIGPRSIPWSPGTLNADATYRAILPMPAAGGVPHTEPAPPDAKPSPTR
jgi:hypothetical protein